jgi:alkylhydroperoxidase family enzyme
VDFDAVRNAGFSDGEIAEIIAHVALNVSTNYFNNVAGVEVDFPKIALRQSA